MTKKVILTIVLTACLIFFSCSSGRKQLIKMGEEELANYEVSLKMSQVFLRTWEYNSGFLTASLGTLRLQLPAECIKGWESMDELGRKFRESGYVPEALNDYEWGEALGFRVLMGSAMVQHILKQYAPNVVSLIGTFFIPP